MTGRRESGEGGAVRAGLGALLLFVAAALALPLSSRNGPAVPVAGRPGPGPQAVPGDSVSHRDFVGPEVCGECHEEVYDRWRGSTHGRAGGLPDAATVIAPFDGTPITFGDAMVIPSVGPDGAHRFTVERPGRPDLEYRVDGVVGRGHLAGGGTQGFLSEFPDGTLRFLPWDWSRTEGRWFCNTGWIAGWWISGGGRADLRPDRGWVPIVPEMKLTDCGDWPPIRIMGPDTRHANCQQCHGSQVTVTFDREQRRYLTRMAGLAVNCESCHGPGQEHVARAREGRLAASPELAIAVPDTLSEDTSLTLCFRCHALKRQIQPGFLPGKEFRDHWSLALPMVGGRPFLPDGRVRTFAYQGNHLASACYLQGEMTCVDCHDPHGQGYRDVDGRPLPGRFDDGQCTGCHASKAGDPERHTMHPPDSEGSRCVACHMPYLQHPELGEEVRYARSDHTIPVPRPALDAELGLESACVQCHADRSPGELASQARAWWGSPPPLEGSVAAVLRVRRGRDAGARAAWPDPDVSGGGGPSSPARTRPPEPADYRALVTDAEEHPMARAMALSELLDGYLRPEMDDLDPTIEEGLRRLAASGAPPDGILEEDLQALALASLHVARGGDPDVRGFLESRLEEAGSGEGRLRRRWAAALRFGGEARRQRGAPTEALAFFRKAVEITPDDPLALVDLASALSALGDAQGALAWYRRSLELDPAQPVAWVNLGLGLEALGRAEEAEEAYGRAAELNPWEALAHLNLGNLRLREEDYERAIPHYRAAVRSDPALARARLYLAISYVNTGAPERALEELRAAAEFAPEDPEIRRLLRELTEALARPDGRARPDRTPGRPK